MYRSRRSCEVTTTVRVSETASDSMRRGMEAGRERMEPGLHWSNAYGFKS